MVTITQIALLAGCGATLRPEVNTETAVSPGPVVSVVATPRVLDNGWYQYTDPTIGYSFSYPPQTKVKIGQSRFGNHSAQLQFKLPGVTGYQGMVIRVQANPNDLPIDQILAQLYQQSAQEIAPEELLTQVEVMTVAGQPALKTSILPLNTEFSILFLHHNRVYILAPVHGPTADPNMNYPGLVVIIEHTLASGQKVYSMYAHLDDSSLEVEAGQVVSRGQRLGAVLYQDYTGRYPEHHPSGDDSHLHYELRDFYNGRNIYSAHSSCNGLIPGRGYTYPENPDKFPSSDTSYANPDTFFLSAP